MFELVPGGGRAFWTGARGLKAVAGNVIEVVSLFCGRRAALPARCRARSLAPCDDSELAAKAAPMLRRLLVLTLELRDTYKDYYWAFLPTPLIEMRLMCGEHGRRQTELARRLAARLAALGRPVESPMLRAGVAPVDCSAAPRYVELSRLLSAHRAVMWEAKALVAHRTAPAWISHRELVLADVVATNRRQAAVIARRLVADERTGQPLSD